VIIIGPRKSEIRTIDEWSQEAAPKSPTQWVQGRSAYELAHAWCGSGTPVLPLNMADVLRRLPIGNDIVVETVLAEHRISFDAYGGEPRNADLAFVASGTTGTAAVTVEAKADEPFGSTVGEALAEAIERSLTNPRSQAAHRVLALTRSVLRPRAKGAPKAVDLRYQLLTATAGSLAYAVKEGADAALLLVHEFVTDRTNDARHTVNSRDLAAFVQRLTATADAPTLTAPWLLGPFNVPSKSWETVPLFIGKVETARRSQLRPST
jgi:hypothetical protein